MESSQRSYMASLGSKELRYNHQHMLTITTALTYTWKTKHYILYEINPNQINSVPHLRLNFKFYQTWIGRMRIYSCLP